MVASEGFEPPNAMQSDLQSDPFGRLGNSPSAHPPGLFSRPEARETSLDPRRATKKSTPDAGAHASGSEAIQVRIGQRRGEPEQGALEARAGGAAQAVPSWTERPCNCPVQSDELALTPLHLQRRPACDVDAGYSLAKARIWQTKSTGGKVTKK